MFKRIIAPTIIGLVAAVVYSVSCLVIPGIVVLIVCAVPVIGTIINFLMRLMFLNVSALDLFYAASSAMVTILFILICTRYDKRNEYNAENTARGIATTLIVIILIAVTVFAIHEGQSVLQAIFGVFPYFASAVAVACDFE